ncbi:serine/threonine-protein kinase [Cryptosporangium aurantiacum]|uniref:Serine/threonine protein kinase n=1 Tax=Cryptosporangium aurantiacum TaxID=134849 RepID=A0A1M7RB77_9ACTN|nr:serine/threonine-protein kinase [Cryptosporangium aurantiacum]SHN43318.1 Serine/threonine protein kinase [Cryptosporangium aurantiacum]
MEWRPGDRIIDLYDVLGVLGRGGMGVVYHVRHLGWETDLAVKSPHPEFFRGEADRERFVREAETWVSLGLHPHVCGCHYVRTLDGEPRVFAEYLDGGSLRDWIDDGRLYRGGPADRLSRVLDFAVQIAWGLDHAHARGLVHQDVKPANVLLDRSGTAKVSDFGLARMRTVPAASVEQGGSGASVLVEGAGMTPAYASPEQAAGLPVGRRTDVWSFAVSVLEMCVGGVSWMAGPAAGLALADARDGHDDHPVPIPRALADLLARCLADDPSERPASMRAVAAELIEIWAAATGGRYPRAASLPAELRADQLNNRALSLLDLGRPEEAEAAFAEAHLADPQHPEAVYNLGLLRWRTSRGTDQDLLDALERVRLSAGDSTRVLRLLAAVHVERGDRNAAMPPLDAAARLSPNDSEVARTLRSANAATVVPARLLGSLEVGGEPSALSLSADATIALAAGWSERGTRRGRRSPHGKGQSQVLLWRTSEPGAQPLDGYDRTHRVRAAALSADGRVAVFDGGRPHEFGGPGWVHLWDTAQVRREGTIAAHPLGVESLAVSADGRVLLSAGWGHGRNGRESGENDVLLWELPWGGRPRRLGTAHSCRLIAGGVSTTHAALSADGRFAMSGSDVIDTPSIWNTATGSATRLPRADTVVGAVALSADGRLALTGGSDQTLGLWDSETGRCVRVLHGHTSDVNSVAMSGDGRYGLSGSDDKTVRLWELGTGRCLYTLRQDDTSHGVWLVALSADGRHALTGADDEVRFWRLPVGVPGSFELCRPRSHAELAGVAERITTMLDDGEQAITAGHYPHALTVLTEARDTPGYERAPDVLAAWRRLGQVTERIGLRGAWPVRVFEGHEGAINASSLGHRLAVSVSRDQTMRVWDLESGRCVRTLDVGPTDDLFPGSVALSHDDRTVVLARGGRSVEVWDVDSGRRVRTLDGHTANTRRMELRADGEVAVSASLDGTIRTWEVATGRCTATIEACPPHGLSTEGGGVYGLSVSADGRLALSTTRDNDAGVTLWDVTTGRHLRTFRERGSTPMAVTFTPDARQVVSANADKTIRIWDTATGRRRHVIDAQSVISTIHVTNDGRFAVSRGVPELGGPVVTHPDELRVQLWDLRTGRRLRTLDGHTDTVRTLSLSRDDRYVLSGGKDRTVRLWELDWDLRVPGTPKEGRGLLGRFRTGR